MKYQFIHSHRGEFGLEKMCRTLGVSRSGYYSWLTRKPTCRSEENARLETEIQVIHEESRRTYGLIRLLKDLIVRGFRCGKNRLYRLMKKLGIFAKTRKKFKVTTHSKHNYPVSDNLLNRNFQADEPDRVWVSDITYLRTDEGWAYLCVILDLYSRKVVGWALSHRLTADLAIKALRQAVWNRRPGPGLVFHSDRGVQYACKRFRNLLKAFKMVSSMSRKGNCWDNAVSESFFHTLKCECVYWERYRTRKQALSSVFEYIEVFYNRKRRHSTLDYMAPEEFEKRVMKNIA